MTGPELPQKPGEFDLIAAIRSSARASSRVKIGIGDDCASISWPESSELLITTDMLMDGRHFRLGEATAEQIGYKCLAVNLSDIAAMAGEPIAAVVAVALPRSDAEALLPGIHRGMIELANDFGVDLVGGDTNAWDGPLVVSVTLLGKATAKGPLKRSGARPGDWIYVTGPLGGSIRGRHLAPSPRIREALAIRSQFDITAMIDLSDGLASDLGHILDESGGLGAVLQADKIPIHADVEGLSDQSDLEHALTDGEDFELCFTLSAEDHTRMQQLLGNEVLFPFPSTEGSSRRQPAKLHCVGQIVEEGGVFVQRTAHDRPERWLSKGFDHMKS